jgi:hypothetical protein
MRGRSDLHAINFEGWAQSMKATMAIVAILAVGLVRAAIAENLYFKIVDGSGKIIGQAATDSADVSGLEKSLQAVYPGIKLSIANCRQPTLAESMDPVYGKSWQCGAVVYKGTVLRAPTISHPTVAKFPPSGQWHYLGFDANNIVFFNEAHHDADGIFIWIEDYDGFSMAEAVSERSGTQVTRMDMEDAPDAAHRVAEEIADADPTALGTTHRTNRRAQKDLYQVDCASMQMKSIQSIDADGKISDFTALGQRWFKPNAGLDPRWKLVKILCVQ